MISSLAGFAGRFGIKPREAERFLKFLVVGTVGFVVDFGTLAILKELVGLPTIIANTISFSAAVVSNFTLNRYWTYPDSRSKPIRSQMSQFTVVSLVGLALNNGILVTLERVLDRLFVQWAFTLVPGYIPAKMVATVVVLFWNFFVNRYWTYSDVE